MKKRIGVLLEFGIPPYRDFLFRYLKSVGCRFLVIHNGEKFSHNIVGYDEYECKTISFFRFKFYLGIKDKLDDLDVLICSFNFWRPSCWLPLFFQKNKRVILWGHIQGSHKNFFSRFFKKACMNRASYILSYTEKGKRYAVEELDIASNKVLVVRNTLFISNSAYCNESRRYFLYVGRVQERKGLADVIKSLTKWNSSEELFRIVGDGDYKEELVGLVEKLNLSGKVTFYPGTFDDEVLKKHFEYALAYVSPSQLGLGVVHAFAYGIPVFADRSKPHGPEFEYCNEENSFLYNGSNEMIPLMEFILKNRNQSLIKGKSAFTFFQSNLGIENMQNVFFKSIYN